jgi:pimeloyl-ACP methyl ester carboxylesterase
MNGTVQPFDAALPHGITLACRRLGARGAPRVLLLHGFPEAAFVWDGVMARLAARAECIAPNLRGYAGSSAPREVEAYRARHLAADIAALIEQLGAPVDLLVAHDWGGALAWGLAALRPELMRRLLIINSPHPATFLRELRDNPAQQQASAYMNFLCRPDAEALLADNDFARLWPFFTRMGGEAWLTDALRDQYRAVWRAGLTGPLNYYRASPLRPDPETLRALQLPPATLTVDVPTTVLWADGDTALLPGLLDGLEAWVPRLEVQRVPGATHWIVHEQPGLVADTIRRLL